MKKRIVSIFSLVALIALSGCNNNSSSSNGSTNNSTSNTTSDAPSADAYEVKVLLPNGSSAGEGISVQWCSAGTCYDASTNSEGVAYKELDSGDYDVKLFGYPSEYAYQLGQVATSDNRKLEIRLQEILTPSPKYENDNVNEAGSAYNPYIVGEGVYNATIENEEDIQYFEFIPTRPGKYVVESLGTSMNLITANPFVNYYGNNVESIGQIIESDDNSGYDVNFALEINILEEDITNTKPTYTFGIGATPVKSAKTFPFVVKWVEN